MKKVVPKGVIQIGPAGEIRFRTYPPCVPGEKVIVKLSDTHSVIVECNGIGENFYNKGRMVGKCPPSLDTQGNT